MTAGKKREDHRGLLEALRHPLRRDLLRLVVEHRDLSPIHAAREVERPVSVVSYHLRELAKEGAVVLEEGESARDPLELAYAVGDTALSVPAVREAIGLPP